MNRALNIVRRADLWVSSEKAAIMLGRSLRWVQRHKDRMRFRRKGTRNLEFELSSILKLEQLMTEQKEAA